ncbi:MAG: hypothetical protein L3J82_07120 [Planctomycetes bacterium]|nr:hypothetical protein [Planctomycetota bacterium]
MDTDSCDFHRLDSGMLLSTGEFPRFVLCTKRTQCMVMEQPMSSRTSNLKRKNMRYSNIAVTALFAFLGGFAFNAVQSSVEAKGDPAEIRTKKLVITDDKGKEVGTWTGSAIKITDENGSSAALSPKVLMLAKSKQGAAFVVVVDKNQTIMALKNMKGSIGVSLSSANDASSVSVNHMNGSPAASLSSDKTTSILNIADEKQTLRASLGLTNTTSTMILFDSEGKAKRSLTAK